MSQSFTLDLLDQFLISAVLGNTPQRQPKDMRLAVNVLDKIDMPLERQNELNGTPISEIAGTEAKEIELSDDERKFIVRTLVLSRPWQGSLLQRVIPLWDRLYPKWEEFQPETPPPR